LLRLDTVLEVHLDSKILLITEDINVWFIWLGRYTFDLAFENIIKVAVVSHPSLLKVPDDLEVRCNFFCIYLFLYRNELTL
jgi:hypothetical protein